MNFSFNKKYFLLFLLLLAIEILIAVFVTGFIRQTIGDVLVPILIFFSLKIFIPKSNNLRLIQYIFLFCILVEVLQLFNLPERLHIDNQIVTVILGKTFDWWDIVAYGAGCSILIFFRHKIK
ncbi:MAG: DUF2809 domain-containing protein [Flavobacteriaceae bacterium]|nr:DUF2809 domain-containing protein [Flavobacteriaceae bacterium]